MLERVRHEIGDQQPDTFQKRTLYALRPEGQERVTAESRNHSSTLNHNCKASDQETLLLSVLLLPLMPVQSTDLLDLQPEIP
jgi:hypothetical protein